MKTSLLVSCAGTAEIVKRQEGLELESDIVTPGSVEVLEPEAAEGVGVVFGVWQLEVTARVLGSDSLAL